MTRHDETRRLLTRQLLAIFRNHGTRSAEVDEFLRLHPAYAERGRLLAALKHDLGPVESVSHPVPEPHQGTTTRAG